MTISRSVAISTVQLYPGSPCSFDLELPAQPPKMSEVEQAEAPHQTFDVSLHTPATGRPQTVSHRRFHCRWSLIYELRRP